MIEEILLNPQIRRKSFAKRQDIVDIPDLVELPKKSYSTFLQKDVPPENREERGLQTVFKSVFPIRHFYVLSVIEQVGNEISFPIGIFLFRIHVYAVWKTDLR